MRIHSVLVLLMIALVASVPVSAQSVFRCTTVGGVLMTNIAAIDGIYNLGPVFGDLQGSVAAKIVSVNPNGTYTLQHYWVTTSGDTILFKPAILNPTYPTKDQNIVAVPWGNYSSDISGGTGVFAGASGTINYFGMADFNKATLVLRYSGTVCSPQAGSQSINQ
jgi:hypothetical protein